MTDVQVVPTGKPVGVEVRGVDLGDGLDDPTFELIRDALYRYGVVFLRDQRLTRRAQVEMSERLGRLRPRPPETDLLSPTHPDLMRMSNIRENGKLIGHYEAGVCWHTDQCYRDVPNAHAVMYAIEVPHDDQGNPLGGTMFVNMAHAYETLPDSLKETVQPLRAVHSMHNRYWHDERAESRADVQRTHYLDLDSAVHPVVRAHPQTGAPCLFVNERYTERIEGWPEDASRELLTELFRHSTREEVRYVHDWRAGDLLFWDDCMVLHHAILDYPPNGRRLLERTVVEGVQPVPAFPAAVPQPA